MRSQDFFLDSSTKNEINSRFFRPLQDAQSQSALVLALEIFLQPNLQDQSICNDPSRKDVIYFL